MKRVLLLLLLIILIAGIWYGYKLYTTKVPSLTEVRTDEITTALNLISAFEKDSAAANKRFLGKVLEVNGTVKSIDKENATIAIGDTSSTSSVRCSMDSAFVKSIESLNQGSKVTIKGACTGYMPDETGLGLGSDVVLNRCVIE